MAGVKETGFDYTPPQSLAPFMRATGRVSMVRGPIGSTKSTACVMQLLRRTAEQAPAGDGIRYTRFVIVRNTLSQLKSTCLETIKQILNPVINYKVSDSTIQIRSKGMHSDWILMPLDTEQNIQRLLSLELTGAWCSEFRELSPDIVMAVLSRCGRFPSQMHGGPSWYGLIGETNSFSADSPWNEKLEMALPSNWTYTVQPGARDPKADWLQYLVPTYYDDLVDSNTDEWVKQYVDNQITPSLSGQAVFKNTFSTDFHVSETPLIPERGYPICVGMDFARHPAAIITQVNHLGRFLCFDEVEQANCGIEKFINEYLAPVLNKQKYANMPIYIVGDPSGVAKGNVGEESVFDAVKRLGYPAYPATTNYIDPRLRAVESYLIRQYGGKAAFLVDSVGCPLLVRAMQAEYRYKIKRNGEIEDKPDKRRPWADLADALQYAALGSGSAIRGRIMRPRAQAAPPPPTSGWT